MAQVLHDLAVEASQVHGVLLHANDQLQPPLQLLGERRPGQLKRALVGGEPERRDGVV